MLKLIIVSLLVAGTGVSLDKLPPRKPGSTTVQSLPDAGVPVVDPLQEVTSRRAEFTARMTLAMEKVSVDKKKNVLIKSILWSTQVVSATSDGAIVILDEGEGHLVGLFYYYTDGSWHGLPDDFK